MVSWPSAGSGVSKRTYADDRGRARMSGPALGRAILKATDYIRNTPRSERCDGRIHLLCHSMGTWALRGAVQAMRTFVGNNTIGRAHVCTPVTNAPLVCRLPSENTNPTQIPT